MISSSEEILAAYGRFIDALERDNVFHWGIREHLVLVRLVQAAQSGGWNRDGLGSALASAFATDREGWKAIWQRYCIYAPEPSHVSTLGDTDSAAPEARNSSETRNEDAGGLAELQRKRHSRLKMVGLLVACCSLLFLALHLRGWHEASGVRNSEQDLARTDGQADFGVELDPRYLIPSARRIIRLDNGHSELLDASVDTSTPTAESPNGVDRDGSAGHGGSVTQDGGARPHQQRVDGGQVGQTDGQRVWSKPTTESPRDGVDRNGSAGHGGSVTQAGGAKPHQQRVDGGQVGQTDGQRVLSKSAVASQPGDARKQTTTDSPSLQRDKLPTEQRLPPDLSSYDRGDESPRFSASQRFGLLGHGPDAVSLPVYALNAAANAQPQVSLATRMYDHCSSSQVLTQPTMRHVAIKPTPDSDPEIFSLTESICLWAASVLLSTVGLFLLGFWRHLRTTRASIEKERRKEEEQERVHEQNLLEAGQRQRSYLSKIAVEKGEPVIPRVRFCVALPFSDSVVDDCAVLLGRAHRTLPGDELDVEASMQATLESGGLPVTAFLDIRQVRELVVLHDEKETGPYLPVFLRLLECWHRLGVKIWRLRFDRYPMQLRPAGSLASVSLADVAKQFPEAMLIVFAARLDLYGLHGRLAWPEHLTEFPLRVWLDPDPRVPAERSPVERAAILQLQSLLARFPMTATGLMAMARYLAGQGGLFSHSWPGLPGLKDRSTQQQIEKWLALGAQVPSVTWEHFEASRSLLLSAHLPDCRSIGFLAQRMTQLFGPGFRPTNQGIEFSQLHQESLLSWLWHSDARLYKQGYELLDRLLGPLPPSVTAEASSRLYYEWLQEKARFQAGLDPSHSIQCTAPLLGTAAHQAAVEIRALTRALFPQRHEPTRLGWRQARLGYHLAWCLLVGLFFAGLGVGPFLLSSGSEWLRKRIEPREFTISYLVHPGPMYEVRCIDRLASTALRPALVRVPTGRFFMGSPISEPGRRRDEVQHEVMIQRSFLMFETEVTQDQYESLMDEYPSSVAKSTNGFDCVDYYPSVVKPANCVTWNDALLYANKLSNAEGLHPCYELRGKQIVWPNGIDCQGYRLPTEEEWEYAARAGTSQIFAGSQTPALVAWYSDNSKPPKSSPVRHKQPNAWGLYDLTGNVAEWVWDPYRRYASKGIGTVEGAGHVIRGGDFFSAGQDCRVARREWAEAGTREPHLGFRLVRSQ